MGSSREETEELTRTHKNSREPKRTHKNPKEPTRTYKNPQKKSEPPDWEAPKKKVEALK
jgi:hypothetical protein